MGAWKLSLLVVDSDPDVRARFRQSFDRSGFKSYEAESAAEAYRILGRHNLDTVVIDLASLGRDSLGLIRFAREKRSPAEVIVLTGPTTVSLAIEAMKLGVFDDLLIPVDMDALTRRIGAAGRRRRENLSKKRRIPVKKFKVLLVDDEEEFIQSLSERLQLRDMVSSVALDGETALEFVTNETPDVMVLDLRMPGIDGLEVLKRVKEKYPQVQVIILTGHGSDKDEHAAKKLGAFAYLQKPVNLDELVDKLKKAYTSKVEKTMVSAAFAEAGEFDTARSILNEDKDD
jgi:DNA-binding NtrC family response regulator